jgi:hypothetical protein
VRVIETQKIPTKNARNLWWVIHLDEHFLAQCWAEKTPFRVFYLVENVQILHIY